MAYYYSNIGGEVDICDGCDDGCDECRPAWTCSHGVAGGCLPCVEAAGPAWMRRWDPVAAPAAR